MTAAKKRAPNPARDEFQAAISDSRPKVRLPGSNWLLSETAAELGGHLADKPLFFLNDGIVRLEADKLQSVTPQTFRTLVERYVVCYKKSSPDEKAFEVNVTMSADEARGIMASPQFTEKLRLLRRLNLCRLPVLRSDDRLELLPEGYDPASKTLTISSVSYPEDIPLSAAVETINDLFGEFCFADAERSKAVAVSALIGMYAAQLPPEGTLRPCFIVTKNAEGAGAGLLVSCAVLPVIGPMPIGVKPDDDAEMRKVITAVVREARLFLLLDNVKRRLSLAALEAFLSAPIWTDRTLGSNLTISGPNICTVFVTANGCTFSPDMRRRSLIVELHLDAERAEDRQFRRPLDQPTLLALRPQILAACWSLVRNWDAQGRPSPSRSHSAFPAWAATVGGIVQSAGFGCALETASVAIAADEEGADMRRLVEVMQPNVQYTFLEIVGLCQDNECFEELVGKPQAEMETASRVTLAKLLGRYDDRIVSDRRFIIEGKGHKRKFRVEAIVLDARSARCFHPSWRVALYESIGKNVSSVRPCNG